MSSMLFLHVGQDVLVDRRDIVGIFDLDTTTVSKISRDYLTGAEKKGEAVTVSGELPKSFVVVQKERFGPAGNRKKEPRSAGRQKIYISQLSTATLLKRADIG